MFTNTRTARFSESRELVREAFFKDQHSLHQIYSEDCEKSEWVSSCVS